MTRKKPVLFGKYYLLERFNAGGMAEIFKAIETQAYPDGPLLAVKRILSHAAEEESFIEMFQDEGRLLSQLNHPNICRVFESGCIHEKHFIAMEYIEGRDLSQIQRKFRKAKQEMPFAMSAYLVMRIAEGLDYAHRAKGIHGEPLHIVHRDVSPQNILVSYQGGVKLIDFGIARAAGRRVATINGFIKGKFGYMSPEQIVTSLGIDHRSDIFALGVVLYELLVGDRLFAGENELEVLEKTRHEVIPPPQKRNPKIPDELQQIAMRALSKEKNQRYAWCSEMIQELRGWLKEQYSQQRLRAWMQQAFAAEIEKEEAKRAALRRSPPVQLAVDEDGELVQMTAQPRTIIFHNDGSAFEDSPTEIEPIFARHAPEEAPPRPPRQTPSHEPPHESKTIVLPAREDARRVEIESVHQRRMLWVGWALATLLFFTVLALLLR